MSKQVRFDYSKTSNFISAEEVGYMKKLALDAKEQLVAKTGAGNDFLGWIDLPVDYDKEEFARIKEAAKKIQSDSEVLLVIGIGGSYLGARAAIEFLSHSFYNIVDKSMVFLCFIVFTSKVELGEPQHQFFKHGSVQFIKYEVFLLAF